MLKPQVKGITMPPAVHSSVRPGRGFPLVGFVLPRSFLGDIATGGTAAPAPLSKRRPSAQVHSFTCPDRRNPYLQRPNKLIDYPMSVPTGLSKDARQPPTGKFLAAAFR
jgi:hypothetical protein